MDFGSLGDNTLTMIGLKIIGHHSSLPLSSKLGTPN